MTAPVPADSVPADSVPADSAIYDSIVIGGGIAGMSIAYELAESQRVLLVERETTLAYHTTGRSAATFLESYGNATVRALTRASRDFFGSPPDIVDAPLVSPLPLMIVGRDDQSDLVRDRYREVRPRNPAVELLDGPAAEAQNALLRPGYTAAALVDHASLEIDVHGLHQAYRRGLRRRGGDIRTSAGIVAARRERSVWVLRDAAGTERRTHAVVNAAGAWCDEVAAVMGAHPVGIRPLRRTAFMVSAPTGMPTPADRLMTLSAGEDFYVRPDGPGYLCSPADETPSEPCDARPDELEIARAIDALNEATRLAIRSIAHPWAGLRSFTADRTPVVGPDPTLDGLVWFAGQGGYGIQMAPALARAGAALAVGDPLPTDLVDAGLAAESLLPGRSAATG